MKYKIKILSIALLVLFTSLTVSAHHYKGLPHYNYFDNYPQVPILEFIEEREDYAVFVTIYNFQGLSLDMVEAPNDVRFYIYLYDMKVDGSYVGDAAFNIYSHGKLVKKYINIKQEEERIFSIRTELEQQDDLMLESLITQPNGDIISVKMPIKITESFFDKYALYIGILVFFVIVAVIKKSIGKGEETKND